MGESIRILTRICETLVCPIRDISLQKYQRCKARLDSFSKALQNVIGDGKQHTVTAAAACSHRQAPLGIDASFHHQTSVARSSSPFSPLLSIPFSLSSVRPSARSMAREFLAAGDPRKDPLPPLCVPSRLLYVVFGGCCLKKCCSERTLFRLPQFLPLFHGRFHSREEAVEFQDTFCRRTAVARTRAHVQWRGGLKDLFSPSKKSVALHIRWKCAFFPFVHYLCVSFCELECP